MTNQKTTREDVVIVLSALVVVAPLAGAAAYGVLEAWPK